jgi:hypothetical protein
MRIFILFLLTSVCALAQPRGFGPVELARRANNAVAAGGGGGGNPTFVQGTGAASSTGASVAATFASTPASGSIIVVAISDYGVTPADGNVTDNKGNTYYRKIVASNGNAQGAIFIATNITTSATFTVTFNTGGNSYPMIGISEWSNATQGNPVSATTSNTGNSTSPTAGSFTVAVKSVAMFSYDSGSAQTLTTGAWGVNIYKNSDASGNAQSGSMDYGNGTGTVNPSWTVSLSYPWAACAISLQ